MRKEGSGSLATLLDKGLHEILGILFKHAIDLVEKGIHIGIVGRWCGGRGFVDSLLAVPTSGLDRLSL